MVVFDKTGLFLFYFLPSFLLFFILTHFSGTLTSGTISVVEVVDFSGRREKREEGEESVLALAGSVEFKSPHPIAKAIVEHCKQNSILLLLFFLPSLFLSPFLPLRFLLLILLIEGRYRCRTRNVSNMEVRTGNGCRWEYQRRDEHIGWEHAVDERKQYHCRHECI